LDEEARAALDDHDELVDGRHEVQPPDLLLAALRALDDLAERICRHRIEEVDADQAAGIGHGAAISSIMIEEVLVASTAPA